MNRPYLICHMMTSVDGRIDCAMTEHLPGVQEYYDTLDSLNAPTRISGRVTAQLEMSKPGVFARIGKWFKDMRSELKKVQWPTRKQTVNNTVIVIICCIIVGICIWLFDALAGAVITALLDLFGKG